MSGARKQQADNILLHARRGLDFGPTETLAGSGALIAPSSDTDTAAWMSASGPDVADTARASGPRMQGFAALGGVAADLADTRRVESGFGIALAPLFAPRAPDTAAHAAPAVLDWRGNVGAPAGFAAHQAHAQPAIGGAAHMAPLPESLADETPTPLAGRIADAAFMRNAHLVDGAPTKSMPSPNQVITFGGKTPIQLSSNNFKFTIPKQFYQQDSYHFSVPVGGFSAYGNFNIAGGLKGSLSASFGTVLPDYPLEMNAEAPGYVQDGNIFTVDPTLVATEDANFSLVLPTLDATAAFGLTASGGVGISFPSVDIGVTIAGVFIGYSFRPPSLYDSIVNVGSIEKLATDKTENFSGGYATVSELKPATYTSAGSGTLNFALPTLTGTGYTAPFLAAQFDPVQALSQYIPELKALDGSESFGIGSATWSLLSLPIDASLRLANSVTLTPDGFSVTGYQTHGGNKTLIGTKSVVTGSNVGSAWTLSTPSTGAGAIDLTLDYALTITEQAAVSLFGSFGLTLDGPQVSASIAGQSFGFGPAFSLDLVNLKGAIYTYDLPTQTVTLTGVQHDIVFYGTSQVVQTLTGNSYTGYSLKAGGELFKLAAGANIAPVSNAPLATIGILGTLGAAGIYNYGTIFPNVTQSGFTNGSVGIDLPGGGTILNAGDINYVVPGAPPQLNFKGNIQYGILAGGPLTTITNTGKIVGVGIGIEVTGTNTYGFVYNSGFIDAAYGAINSQSPLVVHNSGTLWGTNNRQAVFDHQGLIMYNLAGGDVDGTSGDSIYSGGFAFLENQGLIGARTNAPNSPNARYGVVFGFGDIDNRGTIIGQNAGVLMGQQGQETYLANSGLIEATGTNSFAAKLVGSLNIVEITPGGRFVGGVYASGNAIKQNEIILAPGTAMGTLVDTSFFSYANFSQISIDKGASWLLETTKSVDFDSGTIAGLSKLDKITFTDIGFTYGAHASLQIVNSTSAVLSLIAAGGGGTLDTISLSGKFASDNTHVSGNSAATSIRVFTGNYGSIISHANPGLAINANSYYGGRLTVAASGSVRYNLAGYPSRSYGLEFQRVTNTNTATIGGVTTITTVAVPASLTNYGSIIGSTYGVLLETNGMIGNKASGVISAQQFGIDQVAGPSGLLVGNAGRISGGNTGILLNEGGAVVNAATGTIAGGTYGIAARAAAFIANAGVIDGTTGMGVFLHAGGAVYNEAGGTIAGARYGVYATGTSSNISNAGLISGGIFVEGGGVANTYGTVAGGVTHVGTISGASYGIIIANAAGSVQNETGLTTGAFGDGVITGVLFEQGGTLTNGRYGDITDTNGYAVSMGQNGTVLNAGTIGAIYVAPFATCIIANGTDATIARITSAGSITLHNAGTIGSPGLALSPIDVTGALYIDNQFGVIEGANGVVLQAGQTLVNELNGTIRGYGGGNAGVVLDGGTLIDAGSIYGNNGAAAIAFGTNTVTLTLEPGALFNGNVTANFAAGDVLELAGTGGQLNGLGDTITGFAQYKLDAGSTWDLSQYNTLLGNWTVAGTLTTGYDNESGPGVVANGAVTVTATGAILGFNAYFSFAAVSGVTALSLIGGDLTNQGNIQGGYSVSYGKSGDGVDISGGTLNNQGRIAGGSYVFNAKSGAGGIGVSVANGVVLNSGTIQGGSGNNRITLGGYGGAAGLVLDGGTVINTGGIGGGGSRYYGGDGADVLGGTLENYGQIAGGYGAYSAGRGVYLLGGTLVNGGTIIGANRAAALMIGGNATLELAAGAAFDGGISIASGVTAALLLGGTALGTFSSLYSGAYAGFASFGEVAGADWVLGGTAHAAGNAQIDGTLTIAGSLAISGGWNVAVPLAVTGSLDVAGSVTGQQTDDAVRVLSGSLLNTGVIAGGAAYYSYNSFSGTSGGTGLDQSGGTATNAGLITGGAGVRSFGDAPAGGIGVSLSGGVLANSGTILGGAGMYGGGAGGNGGAGVVMTGGVLTDTGLIAGGGGGYSYYYAGDGFTGTPGNGGAGVYLGGGTLIVSGTVSGGAAGNIINKGGIYGANGDAVQFGAGAATLVVEAGAVFNGLVVGNTAVRDVLMLGGHSAGTMTGLGSEFLGISALTEAHYAQWTLGGTQSFAGSGTIAGGLTLAGSLLGASSITIASTGKFSGAGYLGGSLDDLGQVSVKSGTLDIAGALSGKGTLTIGKPALVEVAGGGMLAGTVTGGGTLELQANTAIAGGVFNATRLLLEPGATLKGFGTLATVVNDGTIAASGGTLVLLANPTGPGGLLANAGATLALRAGGSLAESVGGAGTLALSGASFNVGAGKISVATIDVAAGAGLITSGTLTGAIADLGSLGVKSGKLTLKGALTGTGNLTAGAGSEIVLAGGGSSALHFAGAGTIDLTAAATVTQGAALQAAYFDLAASLTLGTGTNLTNAAGNVLTLLGSGKNPVTLSGAAGDSLTNSGSLVASGNGLSALGVTFINHGSALVNAGTLTLGTVTNTGTIESNALLSVTQGIGGTGQLQIGGGGTISLQGTVGVDQTLSFLAATGSLDLVNPLDFRAVVADFNGADAIDLVNTPATKLSYANGILSVKNGASLVASLHIQGSGLTTGSFDLTSDMHGGSLITLN